MSRRLAKVAALVVVALAALTGCGGSDGSLSGLSGIQGYVEIPDEPLGPPSGSVTEADGSTWSYDSVPEGSITLLYFGYTSCPDVCPTTMADLAAALRDVDESTRSKIDVQFVSTDPNRDTPAQITRWLEGFDPTFHGGRAEINDVIDAAKVYGIGIDPPQVSDDDYQVTHGAQLLVLEPGGGMVGYFQELSGAEAYAKAIPILVDKYAA
ncbi:MAG: SCO family protein [Nocardioidaceae bacterium]|nr:SCO family protein [Nocardioidaceae bacterium]